MLQQLNNYLFQYKTVVIPQVGTLQLSVQPASLDVANQALLPPQLSVQHSAGQEVGAHQLAELATAFDHNPESASVALQECGSAFSNLAPGHSYNWTGLGLISVSENGHIYMENGTGANLLTPVAAQKVLRENVQHNVLVGDQVVQYSAADFEAGYEEERAQSPALIAAWILAIFAFLFIVYQLYAHRLAPESSGLQQKPAIKAAPLQHQQANP